LLEGFGSLEIGEGQAVIQPRFGVRHEALLLIFKIVTANARGNSPA
jgi:hypothetical protein